METCVTCDSLGSVAADRRRYPLRPHAVSCFPLVEAKFLWKSCAWNRSLRVVWGPSFRFREHCFQGGGGCGTFPQLFLLLDHQTYFGDPWRHPWFLQADRRAVQSFDHHDRDAHVGLWEPLPTCRFSLKVCEAWPDLGYLLDKNDEANTTAKKWSSKKPIKSKVGSRGQLSARFGFVGEWNSSRTKTERKKVSKP